MAQGVRIQSSSPPSRDSRRDAGNRHAGGAGAVVVLRFETDSLAVEVTDAGRGLPLAPATGSAGRGLVGVRERVHVLGGSLEAGPLAEGGFRVAATLPLEG